MFQNVTIFGSFILMIVIIYLKHNIIKMHSYYKMTNPKRFVWIIDEYKQIKFYTR